MHQFQPQSRWYTTDTFDEEGHEISERWKSTYENWIDTLWRRVSELNASFHDGGDQMNIDDEEEEMG